MTYTLSGRVIRGDGYGKKLGFPTVNLDTQEKESAKEFPPEGVYAGTAVLEDKTYRAGIVIGPRAKIEAHLIGYSGYAYGKNVTLHTDKFLREYKNFDTEAELIIQIKKDIDKC